MGTKLNTVLVDARTITPEEIAEVAREIVAETIHEIYETCGEDGKPVPHQYDEQGRLINPISGSYVMVLPAHKHGLQMVWPIRLDQTGVPLDDHELARRISARAGRAFHFWYSSVVDSGIIKTYENGEKVDEVSNRQQGVLTELNQVLRRYFKLTFKELEDWIDEWFYYHTFQPLYAVRRRTVMDDVLVRLTGKTQEELVQEYREGRLDSTNPYYGHIKHLSEAWEKYDSGKYRSRLFALATGDLVQNMKGVLLPEPQELTPDEWFELEDKHEEAYRRWQAEREARKDADKEAEVSEAR